MHGIRDHATRQDELAPGLAKEGIAAYAQDLRGHGLSGGDWPRFDSMDELVGGIYGVESSARRARTRAAMALCG